MFGARGVSREQRPRKPRHFAFFEQPVPQRQRLIVERYHDLRFEFQRVEDVRDQLRRVAGPYAERIAGFIAKTGIAQRQFDMANILGAVRRADALIGDYFGGKRAFAMPCDRCAHRFERPHRCARSRLSLELVARGAERTPQPGGGDAIDIQIGIATWDEAFGAEFFQSRIDARTYGAEFRVARIAEAEHGEFQLVESRRAPARQVFDEAARVVRRIAVALRTDDDIKKTFGFQFADGVLVGAKQSERQTLTLNLPREFFGDALRVAGLAAEHDGRLRRGVERHECCGLSLGLRRTSSQTRRIAGQPSERGSIEPIDKTRQQCELVVGEGHQCLNGFGRHSFGRLNG